MICCALYMYVDCLNNLILITRMAQFLIPNYQKNYFFFFFFTGSHVRLQPSFLNILRSTSLSITVLCT